MSKDIDSVIRESLRQTAPDINIDELLPDEDLREQFDIDSMDFLNLVARLSKTLNVNIAESDYPDMSTYTDMLQLLRSKVEAG